MNHTGEIKTFDYVDLLISWCQKSDKYACYLSSYIDQNNHKEETIKLKSCIRIDDEEMKEQIASEISINGNTVVLFDNYEDMMNFYDLIDGDDRGGIIYALTIDPIEGAITENT